LLIEIMETIELWPSIKILLTNGAHKSTVNRIVWPSTIVGSYTMLSLQ
jgi:hypothetical protein